MVCKNSEILFVENSADKWNLLGNLLDVFSDASATFTRIGEAREAKYFLNQGLVVAQTFNLSRRCVKSVYFVVIGKILVFL